MLLVLVLYGLGLSMLVMTGCGWCEWQRIYIWRGSFAVYSFVASASSHLYPGIIHAFTIFQTSFRTFLTVVFVFAEIAYLYSHVGRIFRRRYSSELVAGALGYSSDVSIPCSSELGFTLWDMLKWRVRSSGVLEV